MGHAPISVKVNSCRDLTKYDFEKYKSWVRFTPLKSYDLHGTYMWLLCINSSDLWHIMAWSTTKYSPPHLLLSHHSLAGTENIIGASNHQLLPKVIPVFRRASSWMVCIYQCPKKKEKTILKKSMVCWIHLSKKNMYVDVKNHKNPEQKKLKNPPVSLVASPRLFRLFRLFLLACI